MSIDIIRICGAALIFLCHACNESGNVVGGMLGQIFNVGVPIFFILSGYLHGQKETPKNKLRWYGRKLHRLLLPLYIFVAALAAAYLAAGLSIDLSLWWQTIIPICGLTQKYIPGCGQLWFLTHLLICYLLTPLLQEHTRLGKRGIVLMSAIWLVVCVLLAYTVPPIWCTVYIVKLASELCCWVLCLTTSLAPETSLRSAFGHRTPFLLLSFSIPPLI